MSDKIYVEALDGYDQIADIYDDDMGRNNSGEDIHFYINICGSGNADVLELGCGTGRITLPLAKAKCRVTGIDKSTQMLNRLRQKVDAKLDAREQERVTLHQMNITSFAFQKRFSHIICPFSTLTYIVCKTELERSLYNIREHLIESGKFIFDVFVPNSEIASQSDAKIFHDYRRKLSNNLFLERSKTIRKNVISGVNEITRNYIFSDAAGKSFRSITTVSRIRCHYPEQLILLLQRHGFEISKFYGDFKNSIYQNGAATAVFVCRKTS